MWVDHPSRAWTENEELAEACRARADLGIGDEGSSRPYNEGGMDNEGQGHVPKSREVEKRRLHKQTQRAVVD